MSLLEQASLIVTPNAYKEDVLYSVIPSDGSGDLDVVRATTATRVNSDGLIEVVPKNLLSYSEQFDDASWAKVNSVITTNSTIAPNGTLTADTLSDNATDGVHRINNATALNVLSGSTYTYSFFVKNIDINFVILKAFSGNNFSILIDLVNKSVISTVGGVSSEIDVFGDWIRCQLTFIPNSTTATMQVATSNGTMDAVGNSSYIGTGKSAFIWGAQLEAGSIATSYFPTTTRLNIPRLDYSGGGCPSILVEPQRTNLLTYSEQFDDVAWLKTRCTITSNDIVSPSGTINADKFTETTFTNNFSTVERVFNVTNGTTYSSSAFYKKGNINYASVGYFIIGGNQGRIIIDLDAKELTYSLNILSYKIEEFINDYVRISITFTANSSGTCYFTYGQTKISNNINYNSDGTGFTYIWGAQLEAGSNATSYIQTIASTVTRNADVISKTGISDLIGQTEGSIVCKFNFENSNFSRYIFSLYKSGGFELEHLSLFLLSNNSTLRFSFKNSTETLNNDFTLISDGNNEFIVTYDSTETKFYLNKSLVGTLSGKTPPITNSLIIGARSNSSSFFSGMIDNIQLYKNVLTELEISNI